MLRRSLIVHQRVPTDRELRQPLPELWDALDQNHLYNLIKSMSRRVQTVIGSRGGIT